MFLSLCLSVSLCLSLSLSLSLFLYLCLCVSLSKKKKKKKLCDFYKKSGKLSREMGLMKIFEIYRNFWSNISSNIGNILSNLWEKCLVLFVYIVYSPIRCSFLNSLKKDLLSRLASRGNQDLLKHLRWKFLQKCPIIDVWHCPQSSKYTYFALGKRNHQENSGKVLDFSLTLWMQKL